MKKTKRISRAEARIQFRSTLAEKAYFELGAVLCGFKNLSEFLRVSAYEKLRKDCPDFESSRIRQLSARDSLLMAENLINAPESHEKLKVLFTAEWATESQKK